MGLSWQGEAPTFSTHAALAGGGSVPSPLQASVDTHPQVGGCLPLKPFPPLRILLWQPWLKH